MPEVPVVCAVGCVTNCQSAPQCSMAHRSQAISIQSALCQQVSPAPYTGTCTHNRNGCGELIHLCNRRGATTSIYGRLIITKTMKQNCTHDQQHRCRCKHPSSRRLTVLAGLVLACLLLQPAAAAKPRDRSKSNRWR